MSKSPNPNQPATGAEPAASDQTDLDKEIAAMSLEKCFEELEQIVTSLENETTSLEDSINMFERGMKLSRRCNTELGRMERRIQIILENTKDKDQVQYRNFEDE